MARQALFSLREPSSVRCCLTKPPFVARTLKWPHRTTGFGKGVQGAAPIVSLAATSEIDAITMCCLALVAWSYGSSSKGSIQAGLLMDYWVAQTSGMSVNTSKRAPRGRGCASLVPPPGRGRAGAAAVVRTVDQLGRRRADHRPRKNRVGARSRPLDSEASAARRLQPPGRVAMGHGDARLSHVGIGGRGAG
jgi:hypothetical protein